MRTTHSRPQPNFGTGGGTRSSWKGATMQSAHGCSGGGNRRQFIKTAAATGAVLASAESAGLAAAPDTPVPVGDPRQDRPEGDQAGHGHELDGRSRASSRPRSSRASATSTPPRATRTATPRRPSARSSSGPRCARTSTSSPRTASYRTANGTRGAAKIFESRTSTRAWSGCGPITSTPTTSTASSAEQIP